MDKNESVFKKIGKVLNDPRCIKPLLIIICFLAVLLSVMIVMAGLQARREKQAQLAQAMAQESEDSQEGVPVLLTAYSTQEDLTIQVSDTNGKAFDGQCFSVRVRYPNGDTYRFETEPDGSCYLYGLPGGEYTLELPPALGYAAAGPVACMVLGQEAPAPTELGEPVLDANGNPTYRYRALLGPNGFLLSRTSCQESRVLPVDVDGDGVPDYGVELADLPAGINEDGEEYEGAFYRRKVRLYEDDNRPVAEYAIDASPVNSASGLIQGWHVIDGSVYYYEDGYRVTGLRRIDGKLYYFDPEGKRARALGIDASYYNEHIDWEAVKADGIDFAIVRIGGRGWTSGAPYGDLRTHEYLMEAQKAGVKVGVYFYTAAINTCEAMEEAQAALKSLNGIRLDLPIFIDMEFSGQYPWGRADRLTAAERMEVIRTFCETVRCAGYSAGIYSGQYFYQRTLYYPALSGYTIWMANYTNYGQLPDFPDRYDIWQFSERGTVAGVPGRVDLNVVF